MGATLVTTIDDYYYGVASAILETGPLTIAAEYARFRGRIDTRFGSLLVSSRNDNFEGSYLSGTWHVRRGFDLYLAGEYSVDDADNRSGSHAYTLVVAAMVSPLDHWSIKIEGRHVTGTAGIQASDNPQGIEDHWQMLALKTTVDF